MIGAYPPPAHRPANDCCLHLLWLAMLTSSAVGQMPLTPQAGVLVLRNGQVLAGEILPAGDYFVVTQGEDVELRVRAEEVECFCGSLVEAYEFKARHLTGSGARPHLKLAEWCLRHDLLPQCAAQLVAAMRLEPEHPLLKDLEQRLALRVEAPPPPAPAAFRGPAAAVSPTRLEETLRELPPAALERFGTVVQPILLNRCGAGQCHGPNTPSSLRLLKPPPGQTITRRFTQRNLYTVLQYVDPHDPAASPLLVQPQRPHGGAHAPVFDKHSEAQLAELTAFVKLLTPPGASPSASGGPPATLSSSAASPSLAGRPPAALLSQAAQEAGRSRDLSPDPSAAEAARTSPAAASPLDHPGPPSAASRTRVPGDPYDPELFNRRFRPASAKEPSSGGPSRP